MEPFQEEKRRGACLCQAGSTAEHLQRRAHNAPGDVGQAAGHQPGVWLVRGRGQDATGEGRPQLLDPSQEDANVAEVSL